MRTSEKEYLELKSFLPNDQIIERKVDNHLLGNNGMIVVYPKSEEEIKRIIQYANNNGKKITIAGMGTKRGFGGLDATADILLSLESYQGIVEHTVGDMTLTVKAGTKFSDIQNYLEQFNQMISLDPSWPSQATIGGIIAANDSGPKRLGYGSARDLVIGMKVIYPDGRIIRSGGKVVKNVAGYDMNKLFVGSMGTLGVISEVTVKLRPLPKRESLVLLSFRETMFDEIREFAVRLLDSQMEPVSLELLNPLLSEKLTGFSNYTLAISFEDVESAVEYQENFVKSTLPAGTKINVLSEMDAKEFWTQFYNYFPNGRTPYDGAETEALLKVGVKNLDVLEVMKECQLIVGLDNVEVGVHGGLGHGLCRVYVKGASEDVVSAIHNLRKAVKKRSGYAVVTSLPLSLRQVVDVWGELPSYFFLLKGIKQKVDPNQTLNHKRFIGGI